MYSAGSPAVDLDLVNQTGEILATGACSSLANENICAATENIACRGTKTT
jgi:hypothetical protein